MVEQFVVALEPSISRARLEAYRSVDASDLDMLVNYFLNIELSEALYPTLQAFEIALRNTVHTTLTKHFSSEFWFDNPGVLLNWQSQAIHNIRGNLTTHGKPHDADRIVAGLNFGFWHSMFNRPYESSVWHANGATLLESAFPQLPRTLRTRQVIWDRCDRIRKLRNRVFHYEPIWKRSWLPTEHAQMLEAVGWINTDMHDAIRLCDRFPTVHSDGRAQVTEKITTHLKLL